jgi:hypothetical protein
MVQSTRRPGTKRAKPALDLLYFNGIDPETGKYAMPPTAIEEVARAVLANPGLETYQSLHGDRAVPFGPPFGMSLDNPAQVGWGVVFHQDTPREVRDALTPLIDHRRASVGNLLKVLDYQKGEQVRDWYRRHRISTANFEPELVPYYLLLVGPPTQIPFEFQYLLGIEYAVGRVSFDSAADYASYARSVVEYESAGTVKNAKEIVYWGTCHDSDPATNLSANELIVPLANGIDDPGSPSRKKPVHEHVGFQRRLLSSGEATKANLLTTLTSGQPPALLFTASHGLWPKAGATNQSELQGGLLCQDWPGLGTLRPDHYLTASDVTDDATVGGMIAFFFACFGAGTPEIDQFRRDLTDPKTAVKLASEPFVAALPRRLLSHPNGGALAVIGHVDRAWGFSIRPPSAAGPQIRTFIDMLTYTLSGRPAGFAVQQYFGGRYCGLSVALLNLLSPTAPAAVKSGDKDLVNYWLERNDAQNYVLLGDPAVRIRNEALNGEIKRGGATVSTANGRAHIVQPSEPAGFPAALDVESNPDSRTDRVAQPAAAAAPSALRQDVEVHVEVIRGGQTNVKVPVAVCSRYEGMALAGPAKAFDGQLDSWLTRAVDLGMIGSALGQIYPLHLQRSRENRRVQVDYLLIAGMGMPGEFAADDLRYLMSNVTVAVKSMASHYRSMTYHQMSTTLIGTGRNELGIGPAVRAFLEGILDGYERFRVIADAVTYQRDDFQKVAEQPLFISLVEDDEERAERIFEAFRTLGEDQSIPGLHLEVDRGDTVDPNPQADPNSSDVEPYIPLTLLRITKGSTVPLANLPAGSVQVGTKGVVVLEFSGISDVAAVTVRNHEVNAYLLRELPGRMTDAYLPQEQEALGLFFTNLLIPDDFRILAEGSADVTLELDETTAAFPWEMAAHKKYSKTSFLGTSVGVSRQFRTVLSPPPSSPPALNRVCTVLVIADPAPERFALPQAREEGKVVVDVLDHARRAWASEYEFKVTVRIGSYRSPTEEDPLYEELRALGDWVVSVKPCDPLELALLIVNEHFDVIHYAGHGAYDRKADWAGWVFDENCFLSAQEIFRVRQVPRLVFANACFSAVATARSEERGHFVGLAQAFFARGIPNYIGAGWKVDDACARECARWFYTRVFGLRRPTNGDGNNGTAPPATIGDALREARLAVFKLRPDSTSWGAYQHYGRVSDKLLPFRNAPRPHEAE